MSQRASSPFVTVPCSGMASLLLEADIFGEAACAESGGVVRRGKLDLAAGGTLYLVEIGALHPRLQGKLAHLLENQEFLRVGDDEPVASDVRLVAASSLDLEAKVEDGTFRRELAVHLKHLQLSVPALRDRREDIPLLANAFLRQAAHQLKTGAGGFSAQAMRALASYDWPGNVTELRTEVSRAAAGVGADGVVDLADLAPAIASCGSAEANPMPALDELLGLPIEEARNRFERWLVETTLAECDGNQTKAAERLGMSRAGLFKKMRRLQVKS
jgi:two-component system response regulator HydG